MHDIFISYSHQDHDWVARLAAALEAQGYTIWWDRELLVSQDYASRIETALNASRCVLTVWSTNSVKSRWVRAESGRGFDQDMLVPVLLETTKIPIPFDSVHTADLSNWDGDVDDGGFVELLKALEWRFSQKTQDTSAHTAEPTPNKKPSPPAKKSNISWVLALGLLAGVAVGAYILMNAGSPPTTPTTPPKQGLLTPPVDAAALKKCQQPNSDESIVQAAGRGHPERVKQCIELGVDVNLKDGNQWAAIHAAAHSGHLDILKLLVSQGANINAEANSRRTPLHLAVMANKYKVVHYLKRNGAAMNKADAGGLLPFAMAKTDQMRKLLAE